MKGMSATVVLTLHCQRCDEIVTRVFNDNIYNAIDALKESAQKFEKHNCIDNKIVMLCEKCSMEFDTLRASLAKIREDRLKEFWSGGGKNG